MNITQELLEKLYKESSVRDYEISEYFEGYSKHSVENIINGIRPYLSNIVEAGEFSHTGIPVSMSMSIEGRRYYEEKHPDAQKEKNINNTYILKSFLGNNKVSVNSKEKNIYKSSLWSNLLSLFKFWKK